MNEPLRWTPTTGTATFSDMEALIEDLHAPVVPTPMKCMVCEATDFCITFGLFGVVCGELCPMCVQMVKVGLEKHPSLSEAALALALREIARAGVTRRENDGGDLGG